MYGAVMKEQRILGRVLSMELLFRTLSLAKMRLLMGTAAKQKAIN